MVNPSTSSPAILSALRRGLDSGFNATMVLVVAGKGEIKGKGVVPTAVSTPAPPPTPTPTPTDGAGIC